MKRKEITIEVRRKRIVNIEKNIKLNERIAATQKDKELIESCNDNIEGLKKELKIEQRELKQAIAGGTDND